VELPHTCRRCFIARWLVVLTAFGLILAATAAVAQECPEIVATLSLGYPDAGATDVVVEGTLAVVPRAAGISVVDLTEPLDPRVVGQVLLDSPAIAIGFADRLLYSAQGSLLRVFDLTDPSLPVEVGSMPLPGPPSDLAIAGPLLHLVDQEGLRVVDVSTPAAPETVGFLAGDYAAVAATGSYAYPFTPSFGQGWGGYLDVVDVTLPIDPQRVRTFSTSSADVLSVDEGKLLVAGLSGTIGWWWTVLELYELTDPSDPQQVLSTGHSGGWCAGATYHGQLAFLSFYLTGPARVEAFDARWWYTSPYSAVELPDPRDLATLGRFLLVADQTLGLVVLDTTCVGGLFADGFESGGTGLWSEVWP